MPFAKIILWLPCLRPNCNSSAFTFHHLSDRVENIKCFITIQIQFYSQTHNKSQSFESRTNTNGLCSTSSLTWVNINSKYFSCMLFSEYVYGITQSEILYTKTLLLSISSNLKSLKCRNVFLQSDSLRNLEVTKHKNFSEISSCKWMNFWNQLITQFLNISMTYFVIIW